MKKILQIITITFLLGGLNAIAAGVPDCWKSPGTYAPGQYSFDFDASDKAVSKSDILKAFQILTDGYKVRPSFPLVLNGHFYFQLDALNEDFKRYTELQAEGKEFTEDEIKEVDTELVKLSKIKKSKLSCFPIYRPAGASK